MSEVHATNSTRLLHITSESSEREPLREVNNRLASFPSHIDTRTDIYHGLAYLCRAEHASPDAVIVNVDDLLPDELEFFTIVARRFSHLCVYVYGSPRSFNKVEQAVRLGATGELTDEVLSTLADRTSTSRPPSNNPESAPRELSTPPEPPDLDAASHRAEPGTCDPVAESRPYQEPATPSPEIATDHAGGGGRDPARTNQTFSEGAGLHEPIEDDGAETVPVRVPWGRYDDAPRRNAPRNRRPPSDPVSEESMEDRPVGSTPLLTEEELDALLGDDIAAIVPDEPAGDGAAEPQAGEVK